MGSGLWPGSLATTNHQDGLPPPTVSLPDLLQTQLQAMVGGLFGLLFLLVGTCSAWHDSYHDLAPEWPDYLDSFKAELRHPRGEPGLQFPPLSARQKQFGLNPGHPEYYRERPDFLQFGLQALDDSSDPRQEAAREAEKETRRTIPSLQPSLRRPLLEPSLQSLGLATAIIELPKSPKRVMSPNTPPME